MHNRVTHFEIPSDNPEVNMQFFKDIFNWRFEQFGDQDYWLAISGDETTHGINGAVMKKVHPDQPLVNSISVDDIDEMIVKIERAGGRIVKPKFPIQSYGWLAFFAGPDGNCHGIVQEDSAAK